MPVAVAEKVKLKLNGFAPRSRDRPTRHCRTHTHALRNVQYTVYITADRYVVTTALTMNSNVVIDGVDIGDTKCCIRSGINVFMCVIK